VKAPHIPVLLDEVLESFKDLDSGFIVDCTLGYAGHSSAIVQKYPQFNLIGIDRDQEALDFSTKRLDEFKDRVTLYRGTFSNIFPTLKEQPIRAVLADFGVSSLQLDKKERGFSFSSKNLDMRMDSDATLTAYDVINGYSKDRLEYIFHHYGEIKPYKALSDVILEARAVKAIESAIELTDIALKVLPRGGKIHPATLMFQAIRIEVNNELGEIEGLLDSLEEMQPSGGVLSLITFHSLEDRLVKNRFKKWASRCICDSNAIRCSCGNNNSIGKMVRRKPTTASKDELKINPRSRSAKLRSFRFDS
jgi:16S rRNA (cytosine1402-N4)-methyltransferase